MGGWETRWAWSTCGSILGSGYNIAGTTPLFADRDYNSWWTRRWNKNCPLLTEMINRWTRRSKNENCPFGHSATCWQRSIPGELAVEYENCLFGHITACSQRSIADELAFENENCLFGHSTACQKSIAGELAVENENKLFGHITAVDPDQSVNSPLKMKNALNFWPQHYMLTDQSLMNSPFKMRTALLATALPADRSVTA